MNSTNLTPENRKAVNRTYRVVECFRALDSNMPAGLMAAFLLAATNQRKNGEGLSGNGLARLTGVAVSTASRYGMLLSKKDRKGGGGYELVTFDYLPTSGREKVMLLTPKGIALVEQLQKILGE